MILFQEGIDLEVAHTRKPTQSEYKHIRISFLLIIVFWKADTSSFDSCHIALGSTTLWQHICPQFSFFPRKLFCYSQGVKAAQRKESWTEDHLLEVIITAFPFIPGNKPGPGPFFPDCDLLWPIVEGLRSVEPVLQGACWARGPHCNNVCAPLFISWACARETRAGRWMQTPSKASTRLETTKISH